MLPLYSMLYFTKDCILDNTSSFENEEFCEEILYRRKNNLVVYDRLTWNRLPLDLKKASDCASVVLVDTNDPDKHNVKDSHEVDYTIEHRNSSHFIHKKLEDMYNRCGKANNVLLVCERQYIEMLQFFIKRVFAFVESSGCMIKDSHMSLFPLGEKFKCIHEEKVEGSLQFRIYDSMK